MVDKAFKFYNVYGEKGSLHFVNRQTIQMGIQFNLDQKRISTLN